MNVVRTLLGIFTNWNRLKGWFIGLLAITVVLIVLYYTLWQQPEKWNDSAATYLGQVTQLQKDTTRLAGNIRMLRDTVQVLGDTVQGLRTQLVTKQKIIDTLKAEAAEAVRIGELYQSRYQSAVAVNDANVDRLSDAQTQLDYLRALQKNGTLSPVLSITELTPSDPAVTRAGLKTAGREEVARKSNEELKAAVGTLGVDVRKLKTGLTGSIAGSTKTIAKIDSMRKGGLFPFNQKRKKQLAAIRVNEVQKQQQAQAVLTEISELEREYNKPKQP